MKNNRKIELKISEELLRRFLFVAEAEKRTPAAQSPSTNTSTCSPVSRRIASAAETPSVSGGTP